MTTHIESKIPQYTLDGIKAYVEDRRPVGSFLTAVLSNDLMMAVGRADDANLPALPYICEYVHFDTPSLCHGSPAKVKAWIERREGKPSGDESTEGDV